MSIDRDQLQIQINRLVLQMPRLKRENPDPADFWPAFAGLADDVLDQASPDDHDWAAATIEAMLEDNGLRAHQPST